MQQAPDSNENLESNQVPGVQAAKGGQWPHRGGSSKPLEILSDLAGRGRGEQMPLQVSCCLGLHEDIRALGPIPGPQPWGPLQDGYMTPS